jgi:hypothetical protein
MRTYCLIIFSLLITCSCRRTIENSDKKKPLSKAEIAVWRKRALAEAEKNRGIRGVLDVSKDTILLLRQSYGIELSTNRGKTWTWLAKDVFRFDEFTVDDKGIMWGVERWKGIHEPSYCRMYSSADRGQTWNRYELKPLRFFPYHIHSMPHRPLEMSNLWDDKVYRLEGNNPLFRWQFIKQLPNDESRSTEDKRNPYFTIREKEYEQLCVKRKNGLIDTLVDFKNVYEIKQIENYNNMIYVAGLLPDYNSSYFAIIKNERLLKEFTVPGFDLNITRTSLGRIYLTSSAGAFLFAKNSVVPVFK